MFGIVYSSQARAGKQFDCTAAIVRSLCVVDMEVRLLVFGLVSVDVDVPIGLSRSDDASVFKENCLLE
jgi:hypothetical protein